MRADICRELRIDFVENMLAVEQGPHFADRFIAHSSNDAADCLENGVSRPALVRPICLGARQLVCDSVPFTVLLIRENTARSRFMLHIVNSGANADQRLHHRMLGNILDAPTIDVDLAAIANGIQVLAAGSDHGDYPI
jgi:hypothetical protein